ncbi:LysR family transcriptional regulator [Streptomyces chattanoogensis]|uniref:LysR family transcriptional regulator n=1 Tax=Streptomyces chattanoogensis TaxID=66876 RepID=UPI00369E95DF
MLDVRRLRLLREFAVHGTVAAAAEALCLSGPAVSQQLAALEREAGVPLLEKHGRTLRLTPGGRLLVEHAEVILGGLAAAEAELDVLRGGGRGPVRVAAFPSAARVLLPAVWRLLAGAVDLHLAEHEPEPAIEALRRRETDLAVVHAFSLLPRDLPPGCDQHPLQDDPVLVALPPQMAERLGLAADEPVDLARLATEDWLLSGPGTSCHELTRRACGAAGFVPRPTALASDYSVLTALVAAGAGVTLVPRMALPAAPGAIRLHPLSRPVRRAVYALTPTGTSEQPQVRRVLGALRTVAQEQAQG